ncbi:MAG: histidine-type phosphatase [Solobacterium sp.]|nr:histidine-type phosphatase [Solobacterium sp.]
MMKHCYTRILLSLVFLLSSLHVSALSLKAEETEVPEDYTLQEVVVLSRHNIRAPLSTAGSAVDLATPHEWTEWSSNASELSLRGGTLETEMGQYFRKWLESEEFIPENWRPQGEEVRFYANAKQRTIATAEYFGGGFLPVGNISIETHQEYDKMDPVFTTQLTFVNEAYAKDAEKQMKESLTDLTDEYALLSDVIDYTESKGYQSGELTDFRTDDMEFVLKENAEPGTKGSLRQATSISDALVLQYYEEPDAQKAAFGNDLTEAQWKDISEIKDAYVDMLYTTPLIAPNVAHPLLQELQKELNHPGRKFAFLCGHDSNIASVLAALKAREYTLPGAIESDTPIGSKVVFEKYTDRAGKEFARVRLVYQSTEQLRSMPLLTLDNPPMSVTLQFEDMDVNEDGLIPFDALEARFTESIRRYDELRTEYGISAAGSIPDTGVR